MNRATAVSLLIPLAWSLSVGHAVAEKRAYHISDYDVVLDVHENGDLAVVETIRYAFTAGTFTWAYREIPVKGFDEIERVSLTSPDGPLQVTEAVLVERWTRRFKLRWTFPETSTPRTFRIEYVARGALKNEDGENVLDWKAIGEGWEVPIRDVDVGVRLPRAVRTVLGAHPDAAIRTSDEGTEVLFHRDRVDEEDGVRVIVRFPEIVRIPPPTSRSYAASVLMVVVPGLAVLVVFLLLFWRRVGRVEARGVTSAVASYPEPSLSVTEAAGLVYWGSQASQVAVSSLVFDLARRGAVKIEAGVKKGVLGTRSYRVFAQVTDRPEELLPWEEKVLQELEREGDLKRFSRRRRFLSGVVKDVTASLRSKGLIAGEREALRRKWMIGSLSSAVATLAFLVVVVLSVWRGLLAPAILGVAFGWGFSVASAVMETRSPRGVTLKQAFRNYGRWLRERIENLLPADPSRAASQFTENLPELVLDNKVNRVWVGKIKKRVKEGAFEFRPPEWMELRDPSGNPIEATAAAAECFGLFADSVGVMAVYAGGAHAAGAGGGGGGAGGGGGGAG